MNITFADKKIKKCANDDRFALKEFGKKRFEILKKRMTALFVVENLEELRDMPGHWHELTGNRKGQWACSLDQPYRLIFEPLEKPIPTDEDGKYIWIEIKAVEIIEITDYHKEG
ncbi:proteic killer suppression protein [Porphyromonadaceae bacterium NLAE-zl-C104]|jgi:proteic killer suppression protein|uniref:type II toxin-antitoxin system RelE/ParE family toxin n=1 Tax=Proteiniphilum TaxID=294702 RepID=UPI00089CD2E0|nr:MULTISPECIES: type II toxin-antitoxin system RelE/ParE family toxin [Proteiniphilum]MDY9918506.1 type II toxin-antitoxin system RelE/ParE family toxin [Proteiniphilum sp.]SDZ91749.1 proteic killer suppression protein [Porphyromonadaceae bacterium KH3R12]SFS76039.1 proteic killer suppression protein [Porphyromonadaceae bacterium NLAE-zl-C104]